MKILITGGAGFIGSNFAVEFKRSRKDADVVAFDNLRRRGSELNMQRLKENGVEFVHGDIRNKEDLEGIDKPDVLIECSADPSATAGFRSNPDYVINTNLFGTVNCLEYARKNDSDFIFLSSSRVYPIKTINSINLIETQTRFMLSDKQNIKGVSSMGISEEFPLAGPRTLYGATKLSSELIMQEYIEMYGMKGIINRCGAITGSWQMGKVDQGVAVLWVAKHHYRQSLDYIGYGGKGKQVRDFLHVKDLYRLIDLQLKNINSHNGEIYNVGGGPERSISLIELTGLCQKYTGNKIPIRGIEKNREGDIPIFISDNAKVMKRTGWKPEIGIEQTISEISNWIKSNSEKLNPILS